MIRLVDDDEKDVQPGEPGEAFIKGPIVTQGYHNNPEANKSSFTSDGWLRTGDILEMRGTELFVVDRKKVFRVPTRRNPLQSLTLPGIN